MAGTAPPVAASARRKGPPPNVDINGAMGATPYDPGSPAQDRAFSPDQIPNSPSGSRGEEFMRPAAASLTPQPQRTVGAAPQALRSTPPGVSGLALPARSTDLHMESDAPEETPRFGSPRDGQANGGKPQPRAPPRGQAAPENGFRHEGEKPPWEANTQFQGQVTETVVPEMHGELIDEGDEWSDYDDEEAAEYTGPVEHHVL